MNRWLVIIRFELKNLLTHPGVALAVVLVLAAGFYSLYYGRAEIEEQRGIVARFPQMQGEIDSSYLKARFGKKEAVGRVAYYLTQPTGHQPGPWSPLSLGVRDLHPSVLGVRLLGLESQLYDSGFTNPTHSLYGNFDLGFVFIILLPLWIIGLGYNLISAEEEGGTLRLLCATVIPLGWLVFFKWLIRLALVSAVALTLLVAGFLYNGLALASLGPWAGVTLGYIAFWFALVALVVALRLNSALNAAVLLAAWLVLTVVAPASLNLATQALLPVPYGFEIALRQRQVTHGGWDLPKEETFAAVRERHAEEWAACPTVTDRYTWAWYFAMHQVGDDSVADLASTYRQRLRERQLWAERTSLLSAPVNAQLLFDRLARTDLGTQLDYLDNIRRAHQHLKDVFYPLIFRETELSPADTTALRESIQPWVFTPPDDAADVGLGLIILLGSALAMLLFCPLLFKVRSRA